MVTLAQQSLLALVRSGATIDKSDPVICDQLYSTNMSRRNHLERIRVLRSDLGRMISRAHSYTNFRNIPKVNYYMINTVSDEISTHLFDLLPWSSVTTPSQAAWKEYFHALYDLLVPSDRIDHVEALVSAQDIIYYHNVLEVPTVPIDPKDREIHIIKGLFDSLKKEQLNTARIVGDVKFQLNESLRHATHAQMETVRIHNEIRILTDEVKMFSEILKA